MKISAIVFRFRFLIHAAIFLLAFNTPWDYWLHFDIDTSGSTWLLLSTWMARNHWLSFSGATIALLIFGALCALIAALLRTAGSAYIGFSTVQSLSMHGDRVVAAGPYRFVRNPLYLGIIVMTFSTALLMPPSGAIFSIVCVILFELALIAGEEPFLTEKLGQSYLEYRARVPRLIPALSPRIPPSDAQAGLARRLPGRDLLLGILSHLAHRRLAIQRPANGARSFNFIRTIPGSAGDSATQVGLTKLTTNPLLSAFITRITVTPSSPRSKTTNPPHPKRIRGEAGSSFPCRTSTRQRRGEERGGPTQGNKTASTRSHIA